MADSPSRSPSDRPFLDELRALARHVHRAAQQGDPRALAQIGAGEAPPRRRDALAAIARALGFSGWPHLVALVRGTECRDFGTLLYPDRCGVHWNIWCADHGEASRIRAERGDYLLAYRRDFLVVEHHYVRTLGLDPEDPDWQRIGRDWAQPGDLAARERLFRQVALDRLTALGFLPESRRHAPPAR